MAGKGANRVGRVPVRFEIANNTDLVMEQRGLLEPAKVRRLSLEGVVDSGAT